MILDVILLILGIVVIVYGANQLVTGSASIARHFKVSKIFIGFTVIGFATSAPEFAISIKSMLIGNGELVLNNVIGSNIFNVLFALGVSSLFGPLIVKSNTIKKEIPFVLLISILFSIFFIDSIFDHTAINQITRTEGLAITLFFSIFIYYMFSVMKDKSNHEEEKEPIKYSIKKSILFTIIGLAFIILGGELIVTNCASLAKAMGVSERLITLLIIVPGTSLPELVTSIVSVRKRENDLLIGNIVATNVFNIGIVLGLPVAVFGTVVPTEFSYLDIVVLLISALVFYLFARNDRKISVKEGLIMLAIFFLYYSQVIFGWIK